MAAAEIRAGKVVVEIGTNDQLKAGLDRASARLKSFATAASLMSNEATGPARAFAQQAASLKKEFDDGIGTSENYRANIDKLKQSLIATASPAQAFGVQLASLDAELKDGTITADEFHRQMTDLTTAFNQSAGPVDRLQGGIVALDRDLRAGAITEREYKSGLSTLNKEFASGAAPVDRYEVEIAALGAQLKQGQISQDQYTSAVKKAKTGLDESQKAASGSKGVLGALRGQITDLAAGYVSWSAILNVTGQALEYVRQETEKAKASQDALVDSRRRLAQVATDEADLAAMIDRSDRAAMAYGVTRQKAQEAMFSARSEGWEKDYEMVMRNATLVDPAAAAKVAGQVPKLFAGKEEVSSEQAISGTLIAARQSRLDFEQIATALPQAAAGAAIAGGTFAETAAALSVLADKTKSGDEAATLIKGFATKIGLSAEYAGLGIVGGYEALAAAGEDARKEFLGESAELNQAFKFLAETMPVIKERTAAMADEMNRIATGQGSMLDVQRAVAESSPAEQARLERVRSAIEKERALESELARAGNARETAANRVQADLVRTGASGLQRFAADKVANAADLLGLGPEATATAARSAATAVNPGQGVKNIIAAEAETARLKAEIAETEKKITAERERQAAIERSKKQQSGGAIPAFAAGTPLVTRTGLAEIHAGEAVVPAESVGAWGIGGVTAADMWSVVKQIVQQANDASVEAGNAVGEAVAAAGEDARGEVEPLPGMPEMRGIQDSMRQAAKLPVLATQSSYAVAAMFSGFGRGKKPEEETAANTKKAAEQLQRLNEKVDLKPALAFA